MGLVSCGLCSAWQPPLEPVVGIPLSPSLTLAVWSALLPDWTSPSSTTCPDPVPIQLSLDISPLATLESGVAFLLPCTAAPQCRGGGGSVAAGSGQLEVLEGLVLMSWKSFCAGPGKLGNEQRNSHQNEPLPQESLFALL